MNKDQALTILKQFIDAGIKMGVCQNLESAAAVTQSWQKLLEIINKGTKENEVNPI